MHQWIPHWSHIILSFVIKKCFYFSRIASKEEESSDSESDMDTDSENSDSENGEDVENKDDKNAENTMEKTDIPKKDVKMLDEVALFDNCLKNNFSWLNQL